MRLLESAGVSIEGLYAVVLGRSDIVGSPVAAMLRNKDATVTQCHSKTKNLPGIVSFRLAWHYVIYNTLGQRRGHPRHCHWETRVRTRLLA